MAESSELQGYLDRLGAGDDAARRLLLGHSYERLRLLARRMLRGFPRLQPVVDSGDVAHSLYLRLDAALRAVAVPTLLDYVRLASWHLRRMLLDLADRDSAHPRVPLEEDEATSTDDPAALAQWTALHEAIAALDPGDRDLFDLLYYQGLTQAEAADLLGQPLRTLKTHWMNAKIRLGTALGGWIFDG